MAQLVEVNVDAIDANPFRQIERYPYVERKIESIRKSIDAVGLWEGIIARHVGNRYQIAFGHHRLEAASQNGLSRIPLIVRELSDEQMLQFMGRENTEDYNADFLCMLETWDAAIVFLGGTAPKNTQPIDIARILGWTRSRNDRDTDRLNDTASACNAAHALIQGGYLARADLIDQSVRGAREIVERAQLRVEQLEAMAKTTQRPAAEVERAKKIVGKAAKETARQLRAGNIGINDARAAVDVNAFTISRKSKRPSPLFETFGTALANSIAKMLKGDTTESRLEEVRKVLGDVTLDDDKRIVARLNFELAELGERTAIWRKRITPIDKKVTSLQIAREGINE